MRRTLELKTDLAEVKSQLVEGIFKTWPLQTFVGICMKRRNKLFDCLETPFYVPQFVDLDECCDEVFLLTLLGHLGELNEISCLVERELI